MSESQYVDYDVFLEPRFSPIAFANSLVLATNNASDLEIDLDVPAKRLDYDIEEIDKLINDSAEENYLELLSQGTKVQMARQAVSEFKPSLDHVNFSYSKLEKDFLQPYRKSQTLHSALKRLHMASSLLRSLTWYLYLARQLWISLQQNSASSNYQAAIHLQQVYKQLKANPNLMSLQIIRGHEKSLSEISDRLKAQSRHRIRNFSYSADKQAFSYACLTLYTLESDSMVTEIKNYLIAQVAATSTHMSKVLMSSITGFEGAANDARNRARALVSMNSILATTSIGHEDDNELVPEKKPTQTLLEFLHTKSEFKNLVSSYWRDVASNLDTKLRELTLRNPTAARTMAPSVPKLKEMIQTNVVNGGGVDPDGLEVKVMANAFAALVGSRS
jgi:hypothetical protein